MLPQRMLEDGALKLIWWHVAAVDEDAELGEGEAEFETRLIGFEEAVELLTFQADREVFVQAVEIFRETFGTG